MINQKISDLRSYLGLSLASFGKPLELSPAHIKRLEQGITIPSDKIIQSICDTFHVNKAYFTDEMPVEEAVEKMPPTGGVGERLKTAREEKGWSQKELGRRSDVYASIITRVEAGATLTMKQGTKLASTLVVGIDWLMEGREDRKYFPADQEMINWLWEHEEERREIWKKMKD